MPDSDARYRLTDGELLSRLMRCPDTGGQHHTVRSLAAATGISKSKISSMTRNQQTEVTAAQALRCAQAVGLTQREPLFLPTTSAFADTNRKDPR